MTAIRPLLVALTGFGVAFVARADQCAWIDAAVAERAATLVRQAGAVVEWCQPCGEAKPGAPQTVSSVEVHSVGDGQFRAVSVNGQDVDLAYLFMRTASDTWRNVSKATGCPSSGVVSEFRIGFDGAASPIAGKPREVVGTVIGVEEGEHARCILKTASGRMEMKPGADFRGRCRDLMGAQVRAKYTEELSKDEQSDADVLVLHAATVLRPESKRPRPTQDDDVIVPFTP